MNLLKDLGIEKPLILAPMAGGPSTPQLVAAASNAGILGSLGCAYETPEHIHETIRKTKELTTKPFAVNLFAPQADPILSQSQIEAATTALALYRKELELTSTPSLKPPFSYDFEKQFEVVLKAAPAGFSFTFGLISKEHINACKSQRILTMGTATTLEEALLLEDLGVDAIVAQGVEAGGHRGLFSTETPDPLIGMLELAKSIVKNTKIPVIAAGGIMNGQDMRAALATGAQVAQMGTAFLLCDEAGTSAPYRQALTNSPSDATKLTRAFSGRIARGIENRFMREMENKKESILPFPAQNNFTRDIRNKSAQMGKSDFLSLWAGSNFSRIRKMPAKELIEVLWQEYLSN
ncbi:nitronate monooxygenase [Bdellovibrio sp. ZAP7]|uniref:NAD(P)H-dependent flavin oxidoreductase n=1 Tax=Bdellovibrio sp. ZAP7 TaxID=2231053 RepID=UPI001156DECD|nr:nitronate monooxygenase [Bdellovibrio sp. ZAP7]QDK43932.1 nitronate monooxygenase [Bdellovibrio sp. ZAP7]